MPSNADFSFFFFLSTATPRAGGGARAPVRIPVRFTPSSARHSRPPTPQMPTSSGRPVTPAGGFLRRKSHAGAAAAAAEVVYWLY